jgi:16S rRNA (uracil1498-N3)-methyltransferase
MPLVYRFYAPDFAADRLVKLPDDEAQHLARVLRLKPGDTIVIFDGKGSEATARVETVDGRNVAVVALEPRKPAAEPRVALTLAQALLKSDKMERVIRDAVMLGVSAVQPFVSRRTDVPRAALRTGVRQERWERTVVSSVKQSGRAVVPPVRAAVDFQELLNAAAGRSGLMLMFVEPSAAKAGTSPTTAAAMAMARVKDLRALEGPPPQDATIVIGPEGGWDPDEVAAAADAGVVLVTFGSRTLRADAAGAAAIAVLQFMWNDQ